MKRQLALNLLSKNVYNPDNFIFHSGIGISKDSLNSFLENLKFNVFNIKSNPRFGKTYFGVYLVDLFLKNNINARFLTLDSLLRDPNLFNKINSEILIIDDIDLSLNSDSNDVRRLFVSIYDHYKTNDLPIFLLSTLDYDFFKCDEHIKSRICSGIEILIDKPNQEELVSIFKYLLKQRGLVLSPKKIKYAMTRIGTSILEVEEYIDRLEYLKKETGAKLKYNFLEDAV